MKLRFSSFRARIIVTLLLVVSITSFVSFQLYNKHLTKHIYKDTEENFVTLLQFFRNELITINNGQLIRGLMDDMEKEKGVLRTYLVDSNGKFITSSKDTVPIKGDVTFKELNAIPDDISLITKSNVPQPYTRAILRVKNSTSCYACHSPQIENLGYLLIDFSLIEARENIRYSLNSSILFTFLVLVLIGIFVGILHYRFVRKSLSEFRVTISDINNGNLDKRVAVAESSELGQLGNTFNQMLSHFQKSQLELELYHHKELTDVKKLASIGEMAARLAHEVRNPLMGIANSIEIIASQKQNSPDKPIFEELQRQAGRVNLAITNLLKYTRSVEINPQMASINMVVSSLVFFLHNQKNNKEILITEDFQTDIPLFMFDREQIENVLLNLGINAIQAIEEKGSIIFRTAYDVQGKMVKIEVEDTGHSIPEDKRDDVFSPFFTTRNEGTGLGLAIAREIVEKHNGTINFATNESKGTTFTVTLPAWSKEEND